MMTFEQDTERIIQFSYLTTDNLSVAVTRSGVVCSPNRPDRDSDKSERRYLDEGANACSGHIRLVITKKNVPEFICGMKTRNRISRQHVS